jgi:hypothetical protein
MEFRLAKWGLRRTPLFEFPANQIAKPGTPFIVQGRP